MEPHELAAEADRERVRELVGERLEGEAESQHYEFTGQCKDGTEIPIEVHGSRTVLNSHPSIVGVLLERR